MDQTQNSQIRINILLSEKAELRNEIVLFERTIYTILVYFIIISGSIVSLIFKDGKIIDQSIKPIIIFGLSQIEFLFALVIMAILANMTVHIGYIQSIEEKLNNIVGDKVAIWESKITSNFLSHKSSPHLHSIIVIILFFTAVFIISIVGSKIYKGNTLYDIISFLEFAILVTISIRLKNIKSNVTRCASNVYNLNNRLEK